MFHSLKTKFILVFGSLIVLLFFGLGLFLIDAKSKELSTDIAQGTQAFARLSVNQIMEDYQLFLEPGNFVPFNRQINGVLRQNVDVEGVSITTYSGVILYNSEEEFEQRYDGPLRSISDASNLERVQANHVSLFLEDGRVIYVKVDDEGNVEYVNLNENMIDAPTPQDRIKNIVVPYENAFAVSYGVTYDALAARLAKARLQIIIIAAVGLLLSLMVSYMLSVSITNPILKLKMAALKIATGDFKVRVDVKTKDEVGVLGKTFNKMAKDLEIATEARVYQERVAKELELAVEIQKQLLPKEKYSLPKLDMAGGLIPATEVGGDAFDFIPVTDNRTIAYLGDVTGHGVAAGIVSSIANAVIYGFRDDLNLIQVVKGLNDVLRKKTAVNVQMTMALLVWDEDTEILGYVNAGHPPVLYYDSEKRKVFEIKLPGMALSMIDGLEKLVKRHDIKMKPNDVVVAYSDGVPEAADPQGQFYGLQRLKRIVQDAADDFYSADAVKNAILSDVTEFIGGKKHLDDITVLVLKHKSKTTAAEAQPTATEQAAPAPVVPSAPVVTSPEQPPKA